MNSELQLSAAFELLGIRPGDNLYQARQAYQQQKSLYAEDSLASYALLSPQQREMRLEQIESAYRHIVKELSGSAAEVVLLPSAVERMDCKVFGKQRLTEPEQPLGPQLKDARERAGLTLQEMARRTKIGTRYLEGIESERFELLPAEVYLRGFVLQYAQLVGLEEPERLAEQYLQRRRSLLGETPGL